MLCDSARHLLPCARFQIRNLPYFFSPDLARYSARASGLEWRRCMSATQGNPYPDYAIDYSHPANCKPESHGELLAYHTHQPQLHHEKPPELPFPQHTTFARHSQHATTGVVPGPAPHALVHGLPQTVLLAPHHHHPHPHPHPQMLPRHLAAQYPSATLEMPSAQQQQQQPQRGMKRSHGETEPDDTRGREVRPHFPGFPVEGPTEASQTPEMLFTTQSEQASSHGFDPQTPMEMPQQQQHHHHRLPPQKVVDSGGRSDSEDIKSRIMNQPGMPPAFPERPPKTKFKPDEDEVLAYLKENRNLTWKQILWWYPGRTSGTLQVRYCTKLKAKDVVWSDEMVCWTYLLSNKSDINYGKGATASTCNTGL